MSTEPTAGEGKELSNEEIERKLKEIKVQLNAASVNPERDREIFDNKIKELEGAIRKKGELAELSEKINRDLYTKVIVEKRGYTPKEMRVFNQNKTKAETLRSEIQSNTKDLEEAQKILQMIDEYNQLNKLLNSSQLNNTTLVTPNPDLITITSSTTTPKEKSVVQNLMDLLSKQTISDNKEIADEKFIPTFSKTKDDKNKVRFSTKDSTSGFEIENSEAKTIGSPTSDSITKLAQVYAKGFEGGNLTISGEPKDMQNLLIKKLAEELSKKDGLRPTTINGKSLEECKKMDLNSSDSLSITKPSSAQGEPEPESRSSMRPN